MKSKITRRPAKRGARLHRMSKRERTHAIEAIYSTSKRNLETVLATWESLMVHKSMTGALGIVEAVLNRQIIELSVCPVRSYWIA